VNKDVCDIGWSSVKTVLLQVGKMLFIIPSTGDEPFNDININNLE